MSGSASRHDRLLGLVLVSLVACLPLFWAQAVALGAKPVLLLPPGADEADWESAARIAGLRLADSGGDSTARLIEKGSSMEILVEDRAGKRRSLLIPVPATRQAREEAACIAASLLAEMELPAILPSGNTEPALPPVEPAGVTVVRDEAPATATWVPAPAVATPAAGIEPAVAASGIPAPATSDAPTPATSDAPTPAASEAPTPAASEAPTPAASEAPTPAASEAPTATAVAPVAATGASAAMAVAPSETTRAPLNPLLEVPPTVIREEPAANAAAPPPAPIAGTPPVDLPDRLVSAPGDTPASSPAEPGSAESASQRAPGTSPEAPAEPDASVGSASSTMHAWVGAGTFLHWRADSPVQESFSVSGGIRFGHDGRFRLGGHLSRCPDTELESIGVGRTVASAELLSVASWALLPGRFSPSIGLLVGPSLRDYDDIGGFETRAWTWETGAETGLRLSPHAPLEFAVTASVLHDFKVTWLKVGRAPAVAREAWDLRLGVDAGAAF